MRCQVRPRQECFFFPVFARSTASQLAPASLLQLEQNLRWPTPTNYVRTVAAVAMRSLANDRASCILQHLERNGRHWTDTLQISKAIVGDEGSKKDVNKFLYELEKEGKIEKRLSPNNPNRKEWRLAEPAHMPPSGREAERPPQDASDSQTGCFEQSSAGQLQGRSSSREGGEAEEHREASQMGLPERMAAASAALEDPGKFSDLADSLKPKPLSDSQRDTVHGVLRVVKELADKTFANESGTAVLELIGSKSYGVDIHGSDWDYALRMGPFPIHDAAWGRLCQDVRAALPAVMVEPRNKSVALHLDDAVFEIVPFNGPFDEESVPFENLFGTPNQGTMSRAAAHAMLKEFFDGWRGAVNAARVAKAVFCPNMAEAVPWGHLLMLLLRRLAKESRGSEPMQVDWSGVELFSALLQQMISWPVRTHDSPLRLAQRWAKNRHWDLDEAFMEWRGRASEIRSKWDGKDEHTRA